MQPKQSSPGLLNSDPIKKRTRWHPNEEDVLRWAEMFRTGTSVVYIAAKENVAPSTVSSQLPLKYSDKFMQLVRQGLRPSSGTPTTAYGDWG